MGHHSSRCEGRRRRNFLFHVGEGEVEIFLLVFSLVRVELAGRVQYIQAARPHTVDVIA